MEPNNEKIYTVVWFGTPGISIDQEKKMNEEDKIKDVLYLEHNDIDECLKVLELIRNESVLLVISNMTSNQIMQDEKFLTRIHNAHQVRLVYVHATHTNRQRSQLFPKVRIYGQCISPFMTTFVRIGATGIKPIGISPHSS